MPRFRDMEQFHREPKPALPGEDLVAEGLRDLQQSKLTEGALLVLIAAPRLRALGLTVPDQSLSQSFEHELYERLEARLGDGAHSYYNSLIRRIVSFVRMREAELTRRSGPG